jgi:hypothetical protein
MRSFTDILTESKKSYPFKIAVAGELAEDFTEHLETALKKFGVTELSSGKKTPIQERPLDFPQLQNMEVTHFDAELSYPTTSQVLAGYLASCCNTNENYVVVRGANEPLERYQEDAPKEGDTETYETMLTKEDMGGESARESVGGNRVMDLLKELESARKERDHEPTAGAPVGESEDISDSANTKSPIGS